MKNIKRQNNRLFLYGATILIITLVGIIVIRTIPTKEKLVDPEKSYTYTSNDMAMTVEIPEYLKGVEQYRSMQLDSSKGVVKIDVVSSKFPTAEEHVRNLSLLNNLTIDRLEHMQGWKYDTVWADLKGKMTERVYFIYSKNTIYMVSTTRPALYEDIKMIAQSIIIDE